MPLSPYPPQVLLKSKNKHTSLSPPCCAPCCCSDTEIKQLNGWKATVENLSERFDDLAKQQQLLLDIEAGQAALAGSSNSSRLAAAGATPQGPAAEAAAAAADAAAAAIAAEEGTAGPLAAGSVVPRSSVLTPQHHVQLNKLRWVILRCCFFAFLSCCACTAIPSP